MSGNYSVIRNIARLLIEERDSILKIEEISKCVDQACKPFETGGLSVEDRDKLVRELEVTYQTVIGIEQELVDEEWEPWLPESKGHIDWKYWDRYSELLRRGQMNGDVRRRLDESTDRVLGLMGNPKKKGPWDKRGLVVGLVQSGKTSHYIGLANKAVDAGYRVIVILTGFTNSLRVQTQIRTEEGFLGYWRGPDERTGNMQSHRIGVGNINPDLRPDSVTTRASDFRTGIANNFAIHPGSSPLLFVVKKHAGILRSLLSWVENHGNQAGKDGKRFVSSIPLLVIDDESDIGSCDVEKGNIINDDPDPDHDPSTINARIRKLLTLFDQSSYVGYTATPFANVLIHQDNKTDELGEDLFPRSFIVALPTPSDHVGPEMVFGVDGSDSENDSAGLPIVRIIPANEYNGDTAWIPPVHKKDYEPLFEGRDEVPPSVRRAILSFILVVAARAIRDDGNKHNSMLIHVTRFVDVQTRVTEQVKKELHGIVTRLRNRTADRKLREELEELWTNDFIKTTKAISNRDESIFRNPVHLWLEINDQLRYAAESIQVRAINGEAGEVLDYENHTNNGLNVIAVGGDKLSRGLTLEGLSVSYFLRCSRMYDTLMQMGRWFGFRPRYLDLCRLYTTSGLVGSFDHIAAASRELNGLFEVMARQQGNPKNFGLRIRSHSQLMVTSQLKMRNGIKRTVTFSGDQLETILFRRDRKSIATNWAAGSNLVRCVKAEQSNGSADMFSGAPENKSVWTGVSPGCIIEFFERYIDHDDSYKVQSRYLRDYVEAEEKKGRLTDWTVVLAGSADKETVSFGEEKIHLVDRGWFYPATKGMRRKDNPEKYDQYREMGWQQNIQNNTFRIRRLLDPVDETLALPDEMKSRALSETISRWEQDRADGKPVRENEPDDPAGWALREVRSPQHGMLILYAIDAGNKEKAKDASETGDPILAFAISFPQTGLAASRVTYVVNNVAQREEYEQIGRASDE